ncbi:hypothetical protein GTP23_09495 [Pseudoduganella sp. FT93W]|uniref:Uncharacterized protein n=1 Tax=Duganella fentianensis TaxID=2692177 RepID=A0A845I2H8_9BURK|nr:hypothetical protein [Duganella fentianensis]MYN45296.1 hypothetical protein [Duganella fentianensis]
MIEMNAWLEDEAKKRHSSLVNAAQLLQDSGYTISAELPQLPAKVDICDVLKASIKNYDVLEPEIEDYCEAERRTSYRLPPHPKNPEHEEMRDRLIWCRILRYSVTTKNSIVIVSHDQIFKNGAASDEGRNARISIASSPEDLDQRLGERPAHIQTLINELLTFSKQFKANNLSISDSDISSIDNVKNRRNVDGVVDKSFDIFITGNDKPIQGVMSLLGGKPLVLSLNNKKHVFYAEENERGAEAILQNLMSERPDVALSELRHLIGD